MIYFDNAATTKLLPEVFDSMKTYYLDDFGNPNSKYYSFATTAKNAVDESRKKISENLRCRTDEIVFTSGATESNNFIIKSVSEFYGKGTIISTPIEHSSVSETLMSLSKNIKVVYTKLNLNGTINLDHYLDIFESNKDVFLTTINFVNSDTGIIQDLKMISDIANAKGSLFHSDITQSVGKIAFNFSIYPNVDFISLSAHKFHGPKGIGAAIIRKDSNGLKRILRPIHHGGDQEYGYRGGTLNTPGIVGMAKAIEIACENLDKNIKYVKNLDKYFHNLIEDKKNISLLNKDYEKLPGYYSLWILGLNNELFLKKVSNFVAASTGSACSNSKPSKTLIELGHDLNIIRETVRITLDYSNTKLEIEEFLSLFEEKK